MTTRDTLRLVKAGEERINRNRRKQHDRRLEVALKLSLYPGLVAENERLKQRVADLTNIIAQYEERLG